MGIDIGLRWNGLAQEDVDFELTPDQWLAVARIKAWFWERYKSGRNAYFVLAGAAGTGKTALVSRITRELGLVGDEILRGAFTGKATLNLQRRGNDASTIHSKLYNHYTNPFTGDPIFKLRASVPYRLLILDEASMISEMMFNDIMKFGIPTIFIGDHCQLPPVDGNFNIMEDPNYVLKTIHRQAQDSSIILASQKVIQGEEIPYGQIGEQVKKIHGEELTEEHLSHAGQIIVGTNKTRKAINQVCREIKGYAISPFPQEGERMIVLQNNSRKGVYNGQILQLASSARPNTEEDCLMARYYDELELSDLTMAVTAREQSIKFRLRDPFPAPADDPRRNKFCYLDYGYAISCHKSQGSGWDNVLVFDEDFGFDNDTKKRWLYTAITRAKKKLLIVK